MSVESTRETMVAYWEGDDMSKIADNAIYTVMGTGESAVGRENVLAFLKSIYGVSFQARAETRNMIISDGQAAIEFDFVGRQMTDYAGIAPTGAEIRVPVCVVYTVDGDRIKRANIYFQVDALRR